MGGYTAQGANVAGHSKPITGMSELVEDILDEHNVSPNQIVFDNALSLAYKAFYADQDIEAAISRYLADRDALL